MIAAIAEGAITAEALVDLGELAALPRIGGLSVFKSVGLGWQDLAVAIAAYSALRPG